MLTLPQSKEGARFTPALSDRLCAIARGLPDGGVVCDVGSDHGALPLYLLQTNQCETAIVTDLNPAPLQRARGNLEEAGLSHRAEFILTDGIADVLVHKPDAFVIAGMGGDTIAGILHRALSQIPNGCFFALQPMTKEERLRAFLYESGFLVTEEQIVAENGKLFLILFARYDGICRKVDEITARIGEILPLKKDENTRAYFEKLASKLKMRLDGLRSSPSPNEEETERVLQLLRRVEELCERS